MAHGVDLLFILRKGVLQWRLTYRLANELPDARLTAHQSTEGQNLCPQYLPVIDKNNLSYNFFQAACLLIVFIKINA